MSPSVITPTSRESASTTSAMPTPPPSITLIASINLRDTGTLHFSMVLSMLLGILHPDGMPEHPLVPFLLPKVGGSGLVAHPNELFGPDLQVLHDLFEVPVG